VWESHPDANIGIGTSGLVILDVDPRHEGFESLAKVIGKHGPLPPTPTSIQMAQWAETHGVELEFIQPGKPMQDGFIERFNRTYLEEVLDMYVFNTIGEVREITEARLSLLTHCLKRVPT